MVDRKIWTLPRLVVALVFLVIVGGAIWLPRLVDARAVVDVATRAVESATGRSLTIKGPVSVKLWPRLSVVAEDVAFGNAPWATDPEMATAQRVALSLDWGPLLHQAISINQAELDGLVLNLQPGAQASAKNGVVGNWTLVPATDTASDSNDRSAFAIEKVQLNNASVRVRDRDGQLTQSLGIDNASATFAGDAVAFKGQLVWQQQTMDLNGRFEYPEQKANNLTLSVKTRVLDLSQRFASTRVNTQINAASREVPGGKSWWQDDRPLDFSVLPQMNLQLDLVTDQLLLPNGAALPSVALSASLNEAASGSLTLQRFESGFGQGRITATGAITGYNSKTPTMNLKAKADGFDLAKIFSLPALKLPKLTVQGGTVQVDVDLAANGQSPRLLMTSLTGYARASIGAGTLVDNGDNPSSPRSIALQSLTGQADFKSGAAPHLTLDLNASRINLDDGVHATTAAAEVQKNPKNQRWLFGTDSLGFNQIPLMNGHIGLNVTTLVLPDGVALPNFLLKASLQDTAGGIMKIDEFKSGFGQGLLMADGVISQYTSASPSLRLRGHARDFRLDHLISQIDQKRSLGQVQGGEGEFAFHFEGQGNTLRSLVSGLNGEFQLSLNKVTLPKALVDSSGDFLLSVFNAVNPVRSSSNVTQLDCAVAYLPVKNGRLNIDNSVGIETDQLDVLLNGQVDLKQEQMSINIQSAQKSGLTTGVNASGLVVVQGTLLNPSLGVNKTGVVKQAATVGLAVVTSGISLAAQNVLSVATRKNPCQNVLKPWPSIDGALMPQANR